tara:strand:- start:279 stop:1334 length:1056 start_codon:yes stop_codon:yes gene_type:complete
VSIKSGQAIIKACENLGHIVRIFDGFSDSMFKTFPIFRPKLDFVFIALHGTFGEDGSIQKILESKNIKYNGSDAKSSEICFDKIKTTNLCRENKIKTPYPSFQIIEQLVDSEFTSFINSGFGYPLIVKPSKQGSSVGISIFHKKPEDSYTRLLKETALGPGKTERDIFQLLGQKDDSIYDAIIRALKCNLTQEKIIEIEEKNKAPFKDVFGFLPEFSNEVIIERYIHGKEITASILGDKALPLIEIKPNSNVYDYKSKYTKGETQYACPAKLDDSLSQEIQNVALKVHNLLGCKVYSRVDFRLDNNSNFYLLEINTLPGMTETSLFPMAAKASGLSFEDLIDKIIKLSLEK